VSTAVQRVKLIYATRDGMQLKSRSFADRAPIPSEFAFAAIDPANHISLSTNCNPHLTWTEAPDGTNSFALICHDYDVPSRADDVNQENREVPASLPRVEPKIISRSHSTIFSG
jgi:phosphatidylethanolamine-binding protein (PEBP) family uncharacterized protein